MALSCSRCGKSSTMAVRRVLLRGKYNPTTKVRKYPNLQWARIAGKRMKVCTRCLKTLHKGK